MRWSGGVGEEKGGRDLNKMFKTGVDNYINEWMIEWLIEWMNEWLNGWLDEWLIDYDNMQDN